MTQNGVPIWYNLYMYTYMYMYMYIVLYMYIVKIMLSDFHKLTYDLLKY